MKRKAPPPTLPKPMPPAPPLDGSSICSIRGAGGVLFARADWPQLPAPEELFEHCRRHGVFSPRPFELAQPPDESSLACLVMVAREGCRTFRLNTHLLTHLLHKDPRFIDFASVRRLAELETYTVPKPWNVQHLRELAKHLAAHGAIDAQRKFINIADDIRQRSDSSAMSPPNRMIAPPSDKYSRT